jgi:ADP-heptose:LPS heptosyltransferase
VVSLPRIKEYLIHISYLIRPHTVFIQRGSKAIGDNLLLSGVLPFIHAKYPKYKIIVETNLPELFENNPYVSWVTTLRYTKTCKHLKPQYHYDAQTDQPLYSQLLESIKLQGMAIPELYLSETEKEEVGNAYPFRYIVIAPFAKQTFAANRKDWDSNNFQEIIDSMPEYKFIQVGSPHDALLQNVIDGRGLNAISGKPALTQEKAASLFKDGRPITIRGTAAIIWNSLLFVGLEGGLMHVARSVNKVSIIVYSGFVKPAVSGYPENVNLYSDYDCAPCGHSNAPHTDCEDKKCTNSITPEMVINSIKKILGRS